MKSRFKKAIIWFCVYLFIYLLAFLYATNGEYTLELFGFSMIYFLVQMIVGMIVPFLWFLCRNKKLFPYDKGSVICVVNSCAIHGLSWLLTIILEADEFIGIGWFAAICIAFINYNLFVVSKDNNITTDSESQVSNDADNNDNLKENKKIDIVDESKTEKIQAEEKIDIIEENKHCTKCGKEIDLSWDYCYYCGNKLK